MSTVWHLDLYKFTAIALVMFKFNFNITLKAAAYLISKGFSVNKAIKHVRARVPGAIETCEQEELSRRFARGYE